MKNTYENDTGKLTYEINGDEINVSVLLEEHGATLDIDEKVGGDPMEKMLYALKCATMHLDYCVAPWASNEKRTVGAYSGRERINVNIDTPGDYVAGSMVLNAFLRDALDAIG